MAEFVYSGQENLEAMKAATHYNKFLIDIIIKQLDRSARDVGTPRVLDFGAGIGTYADMLKERDIVVDCLELDKYQVALLKEKGYKVYDSLTSLKAKYDIVYAFNVFEHIENDQDVFAQVVQALRDGGAAIIYVPAMQSAYSAMDALVGHHRRYNLSRLKQMSDRAKTRIYYLGYVDPLGLLAAYAYKLFGSRKGTITARSVKLYDSFAFPISRAMTPLFKSLAGKNALLIATKAPRR